MGGGGGGGERERERERERKEMSEKRGCNERPGGRSAKHTPLRQGR